MLSCLYQGREFNNNEEGYTEDEIRQMGKSGQLKCPYCNTNVRYWAKGKIVNHFKHLESSCNEKQYKKYDKIDNVHDELVEFVYEWVRMQVPENVKVIKQKFISDIKQMTDIYYEHEGLKVAIEVQFKYKNFNELNEKRGIYKQAGINDIWIFAREGSKEIGSPYERHYYRSNNRELSYIEADGSSFTYYKGLKKEKFDTEKVPLRYYITHTCSLNDLKIINGKLQLPLWREKYFKLIQELRNRFYELRRAKAEEERLKKQQREQLILEYQRRHQERQEYDNRKNQWLDTQNNIAFQKQQKIINQKETKPFELQKVNTWFLDYKSYKISQDNKILELCYRYNEEIKKSVFEITSISHWGMEFYIVAKSKGKMYDIAIFNFNKKVKIVECI